MEMVALLGYGGNDLCHRVEGTDAQQDAGLQNQVHGMMDFGSGRIIEKARPLSRRESVPYNQL